MPSARRRAAAARFPAIALPAVGLSAELPAAAVVAVPTRTVDDAVALAGSLPPSAAGVDLDALLARE